MSRLQCVLCLIALAFAGCDDGDDAHGGPGSDDAVMTDGSVADASMTDASITDASMTDTGLEPDALPDGGLPGPSDPALIETWTLSAQAYDRLAGGDDLDEVHTWLADQPAVISAEQASTSLRFQVEGGDPHWIYLAPEEFPTPDLETMIARQPIGQASVIREDTQETRLAEEKQALLLEPFNLPDFPSQLGAARVALEATRDYEGRVLYLPNTEPQHVQSFPLDKWSDWARYDFIWISTHGDRLEDDRQILYTSRFCGLSAVFYRLRNETTLAGQSWGSFLGKPPGALLYDETIDLTEAERQAVLQAAEMDVMRLKATTGLDCQSFGVTQHGQLNTYTLIGMTARFFERRPHHPRGLNDTFLYIDACHGAGLPLSSANGRPSTYVGWDDYIGVPHSNAVGARLINTLLTRGLTLEVHDRDITMAGLNTYQTSRGGTAVWSVDGRGDVRVREVVHFTDELGDLRPYDGYTLDSRAETANSTRVALDIQVDGIGDDPPERFELRIDNEQGQTLYGPTPLAAGGSGDTRAFAVPVSLPFRSDMDTPYTLVARLSLPEGGESTHTIRPMIAGAPDFQWQVRGATTFLGPVITATSAQAVPAEDGLFWTLLLSQEDGGTPLGTLAIQDHPGRTPGQCGGPTGAYRAIISVSDDRQHLGLDGTLTISQFDEQMFLATFSGPGEQVDSQNPGEGPVPVPNGSAHIRWPRSGCDVDPVQEENFVGGLSTDQTPELCIDVYTDAPFGQAMLFDMICQEPATRCTPDPCTAQDRIGQCDFRNPAVMPALRGQVYNHYPNPDPDGLTPAELEANCGFQGGEWRVVP